MNLGFDPSWIAAGGALALVAGFWDKLRSFVNECSKVMIVSMDMDHATSSDVVRYMRAHYKWIQFSDFNIRTVHKTRIDNGLTIWVPFKTPVSNGLYKGPHGWVWMNSWSNATQLRAIRGTFDFLALVKAANEYDNSLRQQENPQRFYIHKVLGSEKGAWALGEALRERRGGETTATDSPAPSGAGKLNSDEAFGIRVFEDIDKSFIYPRELYTRSGRTDPFKGLFYNDDALKEVENARSWMKMGKWYADRSIPHRRGLMIYGPGGTGKSSYAKALAESLGIPIYQFFLNTLSDQEFIREWSQMSTPCVALLEDFDNVFHGRVPQTEHKALTFDAVLNQISGVSSLNGVYLIVTTNHLDLVDPAMGVSREGEQGGISTRPGRIDRVLYMGNAPEAQRRKIAAHILKDWPDAVEDVVAKTDNMTPAQVQETCTQLAYERLSV